MRRRIIVAAGIAVVGVALAVTVQALCIRGPCGAQDEGGSVRERGHEFAPSSPALSGRRGTQVSPGHAEAEGGAVGEVNGDLEVHLQGQCLRNRDRILRVSLRRGRGEWEAFGEPIRLTRSPHAGVASLVLPRSVGTMELGELLFTVEGYEDRVVGVGKEKSLHVVMSPSARVSGRVIDADGSPLWQIPIVVQGIGADGRPIGGGALSFTGEDGLFSLPWPPGEAAVLRVNSRDYLSVEHVLYSGAPADVQLRLARSMELGIAFYRIGRIESLRRFRVLAGDEGALVSEGALEFKSVPAPVFADRPAVRRHREHRMEYRVAKLPLASRFVDVEILEEGDRIIESRRFGIDSATVELEVEVR